MSPKVPSSAIAATRFAFALFLSVVLLPLAPFGAEAQKPIVYKNSRFRFQFSLPPSWKGYTILISEWSGADPTEGSTLPRLRGPVITIRNPRWSEKQHWQDIPIMVFTLAEWDRVAQETLVVSAAPFGPEEIGRNESFVFALPPRYTNDGSAQGVQEVLRMVHGGALRPIRSAQPMAEPKLSEPGPGQSKRKPTGPPSADPDSDLESVVYTVAGLTFPGAGPQHTETFQFTAPNFITSSISLSASRLDSCVNCIQSGTAVQFFPKGTLRMIVPADSVHFTDADGIVYGWVFPPGAFSAAGTYTAFDYPPYIVSDVAIMTVRAVRATPETTSKGRSLKCLYLWGCATRVKTASRTAPP